MCRRQPRDKDSNLNTLSPHDAPIYLPLPALDRRWIDCSKRLGRAQNRMRQAVRHYDYLVCRQFARPASGNLHATAKLREQSLWFSTQFGASRVISCLKTVNPACPMKHTTSTWMRGDDRQRDSSREVSLHERTVRGRRYGYKTYHNYKKPPTTRCTHRRDFEGDWLLLSLAHTLVIVVLEHSWLKSYAQSGMSGGGRVALCAADHSVSAAPSLSDENLAAPKRLWIWYGMRY